MAVVYRLVLRTGIIVVRTYANELQMHVIAGDFGNPLVYSVNMVLLWCAMVSNIYVTPNVRLQNLIRSSNTSSMMT